MIEVLENFRDVITIDELCVILRIGKNSAYKLLQSNQIRNRKLGGKYIIPKNSIIHYLSEISGNGENNSDCDIK